MGLESTTPRVLAYDTETYQGTVKVLTCSDGSFVETDSTDSILDWLYAKGRDADYNVWWNIGFDFGCILKKAAMARKDEWRGEYRKKLRRNKTRRMVEAEMISDVNAGQSGVSYVQLRTLRELDEADNSSESVESFNTAKYHVRYIVRKGFRITPRDSTTKRKHRRAAVSFFDAMPWWASGLGESASLDSSALRYLHEGKNAEAEGVDRVKIGSVEGYYEDHREAIIRYSIKDCDLTRRLFVRTIEAFAAIDMPFPKHPWSRASVSREYIQQAGTLEATSQSYKKLAETAFNSWWTQAYAGACIFSRGIGTWTSVTRFDLVSAYPHEMRLFPSLEGAFVVGRDDPRFEACYFKFHRIRFAPTPRRALRAVKTADGAEDGSTTLQYNRGGPERFAMVTQLDLDTFDAWGDPYVILDSIGVVTTSTERPFAFQEKLFEEKSRIKKQFPKVNGHDTPEYLNAKIPMNGCYGIVAQSRPTTTNYSNFIYAAYITAGTRKQVWLKALECERAGGTVLSFMTDGLFVADLPAVPPSSSALGEWETEFLSKVTIFANGIYSDGQGEHGLKKRGAPYLTEDELLRCTRPWVTTIHSSPCSIKQAIIRGKPEMIGVFVPESKSFQPAQMLLHAGLHVPPDLFNAPIKSYFTEQWFLEPRRSDEKLPPTISWAEHLGIIPEKDTT